MTIQPKYGIKDEQLLVDIFVHRSISNIHPFLKCKSGNTSSEQKYVQIETFKKQKAKRYAGLPSMMSQSNPRAPSPFLGKPRAFESSLTPYGKAFDVKQGPSGRAIYYREERQSGRLRN